MPRKHLLTLTEATSSSSSSSSSSRGASREAPALNPKRPRLQLQSEEESQSPLDGSSFQRYVSSSESHIQVVDETADIIEQAIHFFFPSTDLIPTCSSQPAPTALTTLRDDVIYPTINGVENLQKIQRLAEHLGELADLQYGNNDIQEATDTLHYALNVVMLLDDIFPKVIPLKIRILLDLLRCYCDLNKPENALSYFHQARELWIRHANQDKALYVELLMYSGVLLQYYCDNETAAWQLNKAKAIISDHIKTTYTYEAGYHPSFHLYRYLSTQIIIHLGYVLLDSWKNYSDAAHIYQLVSDAVWGMGLGSNHPLRIKIDRLKEISAYLKNTVYKQRITCASNSPLNAEALIKVLQISGVSSTRLSMPINVSALRIATLKTLADAFSELTELCLINSRIGDDGLRVLVTAWQANPSKIKILNLSRANITAEGIKLLMELLLNPLCQLMSLSLEHDSLSQAGEEELAKGLRDPHCRLRKLRLSNNSFTTLRSLAEALPFSQLTCLLIINNNIKATDMSLLAKALQSPNNKLVSLDLTGNKLTASQIKILLEALKSQFCKLTQLSLADNHIGDVGIAALAQLLCEPHNKITHLDLGHNIIGIKGIRALMQALQDPNCKLKALYLRNTRLTSASIKELVKVLAESKLSLLDLGENALKSDDMRDLIKTLHKPTCNLVTLCLDQTHIVDRETVALAAVLRLGKLRSVDLRGNRMGSMGLNALTEALKDPRCKHTKCFIDQTIHRANQLTLVPSLSLQPADISTASVDSRIHSHNLYVDDLPSLNQTSTLRDDVVSPIVCDEINLHTLTKAIKRLRCLSYPQYAMYLSNYESNIIRYFQQDGEDIGKALREIRHVGRFARVDCGDYLSGYSIQIKDIIGIIENAIDLLNLFGNFYKKYSKLKAGLLIIISNHYLNEDYFGEKKSKILLPEMKKVHEAYRLLGCYKEQQPIVYIELMVCLGMMYHYQQDYKNAAKLFNLAHDWLMKEDHERYRTLLTQIQLLLAYALLGDRTQYAKAEMLAGRVQQVFSDFVEYNPWFTRSKELMGVVSYLNKIGDQQDFTLDTSSETERSPTVFLALSYNHVTSLNIIRGAYDDIWSRLFTTLWAPFNKLTSLSLIDIRMGSMEVRMLAEVLMSPYGKLTSLHMESNRLQLKDSVVLMTALQSPYCGLTVFRYIGNILDADGGMTLVVALHSEHSQLILLQLSKLNAFPSPINDNLALSALCTALAATSSKLETLILDNENISGTIMCSLVQALQSGHSGLRSLSLTHTYLYDWDISALAGALVSPHCQLTQLDLSMNRCSINKLLEALYHPNCRLISLNISGMYFNEESLSKLAEVLGKRGCQLIHLDISNSNGLREDGMRSIAEALAKYNGTLLNFILSDDTIRIPVDIRTSIQDSLERNKHHLQQKTTRLSSVSYWQQKFNGLLFSGLSLDEEEPLGNVLAIQPSL